MSLSSRGTNRQPEVTTIFGPRRVPAELEPPPGADNPFAITRKSLGKTLLIIGTIPFLWGVYVFAYHYLHPAPTLWTRTEATVLDGEISGTRDACSAGIHPGQRMHPMCDYYIFRFGVSYVAEGSARQSKMDSPLFEHKRDAEIWGSQFEPGRKLAIIYDPLHTDSVRRADDPPPSQYVVGPSVGYYPLGRSGPMIVEDSAAGPLKVAFCFSLPGIILLLSSRWERESNSISAS